MNMKKCIFFTTTTLFTMINSGISYAGDYLIDRPVDFTNKPNTGDTNTLIIYSAILGVSVIALLFLNLTGKSKKKDIASLDEKSDLVENNIDNDDTSSKE